MEAQEKEIFLQQCRQLQKLQEQRMMSKLLRQINWISVDANGLKDLAGNAVAIDELKNIGANL